MNTMVHRAATIPVVVTRRMRSAVEFILVSLVWGVLVAIAASSLDVYLERGRVAEALYLASVIKQELTALHAETGRWPAVASLPAVSSRKEGGGISRHIAGVEYDEAAFTFVYRKKNAVYRLSFRAAIPAFSPRAPVVWLCGYASPPAGYRVIAANRTDIPMTYLPGSCRGAL